MSSPVALIGRLPWGLIVAAAAATFLAGTPDASAHLRSGTIAVDYRASVAAPQTPAYSAQIYQSDRALNLTVKRGHSVSVLGYLGEPMFRLDPAGLWINVASPTSAVAGLVTKAQRVVSSTPHWRLQHGRRSVIWRDARAQGLSPGVDDGTWSVPMIVDGRPANLDGALRRRPKPVLWLWLVLVGCLPACAAALALVRRDQLARGAISFAAAAAGVSAVLAVAFALDAYASPGSWIAGFDEIFFIAIGIGVLLRGPPRWHVATAIGLGLLAVGVGLSKGAVFLHPIVLADLPGTVIRLLVAVAVGCGLAAAALGGMSYAETSVPLRSTQTRSASR
jgi:hypothetical protein